MLWLYCSSVISLDEINSADELMRLFFIKAESLYGSRFLTINAHLHLHLQNVFKDYGPCYGYWLFSFERYNGMLGRYHTNQLSIEIQLMRRFIENMHIKSKVNTDSFSPEHLSLLSNLLGARSGGTANKTLFGQSIFVSDEHVFLQEYANVKLSPPFVLHYFDSVLLSYLRLCYQKIIPDVDVLEVPQLCRRYKYATWWSQHLNSSKKTPLCILAKWIGGDGEINCDNEICAGIVKYFFSQRLLVGNDYVEVNMAYIKWLQEHSCKNSLLKPVEIWCCDLYKPVGAASFMPIERIQEVCVTCNLSINDEIVTAVNPIRKKIFL